MNDTFLNSANAPYVAELYFKFSQDPNSVDKNWGDFFNSLDDDDLSVIKDFGGPHWKKRPFSVIDKISLSKVSSKKKYYIIIINIDVILKKIPVSITTIGRYNKLGFKSRPLLGIAAIADIMRYRPKGIIPEKIQRS